MSAPEQFPNQQSLPEAQNQLSIQERMQNPTPEDVDGALSYFYYQAEGQKESLDQAGRMGTLTPEQIERKKQDLAVDAEQAGAAVGLHEDWATLPEESRGTFPSHIRNSLLQAQANGGGEQYEDARKAAEWGSKHYEASLKGFFESQEQERQEADEEPIVVEVEPSPVKLSIEEMRERMNQLNISGGSPRAQVAAVDEARKAVDNAHTEESQAAPAETADNTEQKLREKADSIKAAAVTRAEREKLNAEHLDLMDYKGDPKRREKYLELDARLSAANMESTDPDEFLRLARLVGFSENWIKRQEPDVREHARSVTNSDTLPRFVYTISRNQDGSIDEKGLGWFGKIARK